MSGPIAGTALTWSALFAGVGAASAVAGTAYSVKAGGDQAAAQQDALKQQKTAQQTAQQNTLATQRKNETAQNAQNTKTPDVASILARSATAGSLGTNSTMLTGTSGVDPSALSLGKSTLLGS